MYAYLSTKLSTVRMRLGFKVKQAVQVHRGRKLRSFQVTKGT